MFWFTNLIQKTSINNSLYVNQNTTQTPESSTLSLHKHMQVFPLCQACIQSNQIFPNKPCVDPLCFHALPMFLFVSEGEIVSRFLVYLFFSQEKAPQASGCGAV